VLEFLHVVIRNFVDEISIPAYTAGELFKCGYSVQKIYLVDVSHSVGIMFRRHKLEGVKALAPMWKKGIRRMLKHSKWIEGLGE
jgi:hypothetical protein